MKFRREVEKIGTTGLYVSLIVLIVLIGITINLIVSQDFEGEPLFSAVDTGRVIYYDFDSLVGIKKASSFSFGTEEDRINLGDSLSDFVSSFSGETFGTVLENGVYEDANGNEFDYTQTLEFPTELKFSYGLDSEGEFDLGLRNENENILKYSLNFANSPGNGFRGTELKILGNKYYVQNYNPSGFVLFKDVVEEFNLSYDANAARKSGVYDSAHVVGLEIQSIGANSVSLKENLAVIGSLSLGDTHKLSGNYYLGVKNINYIANGVSAVDFVVGREKIELVDGQKIKVSESIADEYEVDITDSGSFSLFINYNDDLFLKSGKEITLPVFDTLKIGTEVNQREPRGVVSALNNSDKITVSANMGGVLRKFDLLGVLSNGNIGIGNSTDEILVNAGEELQIEREGGESIIQSEFVPTTFEDLINTVDATNEMMAQTFLVSQNSVRSINKIRIPVANRGTNDVGFVKIFLTGVDATGKPNLGNVLSVPQEIDIDSLGVNTLAWIDINIPLVSLNIGEKYALVVNGTNIAGSDGNNFVWGVSGTNSYANGEIFRKAAGSIVWASSGDVVGKDFAFELHGVGEISKKRFFVSVGNETYGESYLLNAKEITISDVIKNIVLRDFFDGTEASLNLGQSKNYGNVRVGVESVLAGNTGFLLNVSSVNGQGTGTFGKIYTDSGLRIPLSEISSGTNEATLTFEEQGGESFDIIAGKNSNRNLTVKSVSLQEFSDSSIGRNVSYVSSDFATKVERVGITDNSFAVISSYAEELYANVEVEEVLDNIYASDALADLQGGESSGIIYGARLEQGQFGNGGRFTGEDYIEVGKASNINLLEKGSYSISAWYKPLTSGETQTIISKADNGLMQGENTLHIIGLKYKRQGANNGFAMTHYEGGAGYEASVFGTKFEPGKYYLVTGIVDRANKEVKIYVNGKLEGRRNIAQTSGAREYSGNWRIGIANTNGTMERYGANGFIDEVKMWNRALSDLEVNELYNSYGIVSGINLKIPANCSDESLEDAWDSLIKHENYSEASSNQGFKKFVSGEIYDESCSRYFVYNGAGLVLMGGSKEERDGNDIYSVREMSTVNGPFRDEYVNELSSLSGFADLDDLNYLPNNGSYEFIINKTKRFGGDSDIVSSPISLHSAYLRYNSYFEEGFEESDLDSQEFNDLTNFVYSARHLGGEINVSINSNYSYMLLKFGEKRFVSTYVPPVICRADFNYLETACVDDSFVKYARAVNITGEGCTARNITLPANETFVQDCNNNNVRGTFAGIEKRNIELKYEIGNKEANDSEVQQGKKNIKFVDKNESIIRVSFNHDFDAEDLDLIDVEIEKQEKNDKRGYLIVNGLETGAINNKTFIIDKLNASTDKVCVKDRAGIVEISAVSFDCDNSGEEVIECDESSHSGFVCEIDEISGEDYFIVSGLRNSAVVEYVDHKIDDSDDDDDDSPSSGSSGSSTGTSGGSVSTTTSSSSGTSSGTGSIDVSGGSSGSGTGTSGGSKSILWIIFIVLVLAIVIVVTSIIYLSFRKKEKKGYQGGVVFNRGNSGPGNRFSPTGRPQGY